MEKEIIWQQLLSWTVSFLCGGAVSAAGALGLYLKRKHKREAVIEEGVCCLLRAEIIRTCEKYIDRDYCLIYQKEALTKAYRAYHALGGNDVATALYERAMALGIESKEEKRT